MGPAGRLPRTGASALTNVAFDILSLRAAYAGGLSPVEVIEAMFDRIAAVGDPGIFIHLGEREALCSAARALGAYDPGRPLWGIPFGVKDNIDVAGMPTTAACPDYTFEPMLD